VKQIALLLASLFFVLGVPFVGTAADVNININVPPPPPPAQQESPPPAEPAPEAPPPMEFAAPPDVVVVPSGTSDVYLVPDTAGLYFYGGFWYRFHRGFWFRSAVYNGLWAPIGVTLVPPAVVVIPPDYVLGMPLGYHRIHYDEFHSHWRGWGRDRHWHNQPWYRDHAAHHWGGREFVRPVHRGEDKRGVRPGDKRPVGPGPGVKPGVHGPGHVGPREGVKPVGPGPGVKPGPGHVGPREGVKPVGPGPGVKPGVHGPGAGGPGGGSHAGPGPGHMEKPK